MFGSQGEMKGANGKRVGVTIPEQQRMAAAPDTKYAPAQRVTNVMPCAMVLARFGDKDGLAHNVCLLKVGEGEDARYFMPPNAELWTKDLKPVAPWLAKELASTIAQTEAPNEIPAGDAVEIAATPGV
jgi:hypothetical protein